MANEFEIVRRLGEGAMGWKASVCESAEAGGDLLCFGSGDGNLRWYPTSTIDTHWVEIEGTGWDPFTDTAATEELVRAMERSGWSFKWLGRTAQFRRNADGVTAEAESELATGRAPWLGAICHAADAALRLPGAVL